jgi:hypothetical protein
VYSVIFLKTVSHTKLTNTIIGKHTEEMFDVWTQLEIKSGNPLKISEKGGTSGKHRRKKAKRDE